MKTLILMAPKPPGNNFKNSTGPQVFFPAKVHTARRPCALYLWEQKCTFSALLLPKGSEEDKSVITVRHMSNPDNFFKGGAL